MNVKVNRTTIEIFEGAKVKDAVVNYMARRCVSKSRLDKAKVFDIYGHPIDIDAPLNDGDAIKCII